MNDDQREIQRRWKAIFARPSPQRLTAYILLTTLLMLLAGVGTYFAIIFVLDQLLTR